jgi:hypothetical protein
MAQTQIRHETLIVRAGLLASDPQHVWQVAAREAQKLVSSGELVVNVQLHDSRPAEFTDNSTDREVEYSFHVLPTGR